MKIKIRKTYGYADWPWQVCVVNFKGLPISDVLSVATWNSALRRGWELYDKTRIRTIEGFVP